MSRELGHFSQRLGELSQDLRHFPQKLRELTQELSELPQKLGELFQKLLHLPQTLWYLDLFWVIQEANFICLVTFLTLGLFAAKNKTITIDLLFLFP
ncbi:MAG: hypothetical protein GTO20_23845 [Candidatus Aminicenantes bacterium]|nr:hypothetical protein [Candidatus Aminicenantes bacterium]